MESIVVIVAAVIISTLFVVLLLKTQNSTSDNKDELRSEIRAELRAEIRNELRNEIRAELQAEQPPPRSTVVVPHVVHVNTNTNTFTPPVVFGQIGYLKQHDTILPLYGEASQTRRGRYFYYTISNGIKLSLQHKNRDCLDEVACEELFDGEEVLVEDLGQELWTVKLYPNNFIRDARRGMYSI